jgi:hypothetical protein
VLYRRDMYCTVNGRTKENCAVFRCFVAIIVVHVTTVQQIWVGRDQTHQSVSGFLRRFVSKTMGRAHIRGVSHTWPMEDGVTRGG